MRPVRLAAMLAASVLAFATTAPVSAQTMIRVASFTPEGAVGVRFVMKPWMEAVQEELGDRVNMVPFWGGALGPNPFDQFDLVRSGVVDVAWVLSGYTPGQFPQIDITELPFGVASGEEASVVGWRLLQEGLVDGLDDVHVLTFWTPDITNIHLRAPIEGLGNLRGTALRTAGSTQAMFVESIGAAPQVLGSVEANEAMGRGTINGQLQGWTGMNTFGGFAVSDVSYRVPLGASAFFMFMNKDLWDSLDADVQEVMMRHGGEALARSGGLAYDQLTLDIIERRKGEGHTVIDPSEEALDAYREAAAPIYDAWKANTPNGPEVFAAFQRLLEEYRAEN
ncbi:MAG: TRAP transporter substrate-binding protein [Rhodobacteraceae bacterium]|nr:TRAP transporter substrate-binding protein [Paracoccaceae bacterium]